MQIKKNQQKFNSTDWPDVFSCRFLEGGIVSYEDSGDGIAYLSKQTIDKMAHTFIGRPVIVQHKSVDPSNYKEHAVGYVIAVHFNPEDAWFYADFIITDDTAKELIEKHEYSVSCAYNVLDAKEGGLWHDIEYDGEITEGSFTHLALVESPRYEGSKITKQLPAMLVNGKAARLSTNQEELSMNIFKLFKTKENNKPAELLNSFIELDKKHVPVSDVLWACANGKKLNMDLYQIQNGDKQSYMAQDHDIVDINGKTVSIGDLKAAYMMKMQNEKKNCTCGTDSDTHKEDCTFFNKKNEKDEEKEKKDKEEADKKNAKEKEEKEAEEAKNAKEAEEKEKKEKEEKENEKKRKEKEAEEKKNAKEKEENEFFEELKNASTKHAGEEVEAPAPMTREERAREFQNRTAKKKS